MTDDQNKLNELQGLNSMQGQNLREEDLERLDQDQLMQIYVEQLIADKGLNPNDRLIAELTEKIHHKINREVVNNLPMEAVDRINNEDLSDEEIANLVEESGIDIEKITEEAMNKFRNDYLKEEA